MTTKTNEQRVIDLVAKILKPLGYEACVGFISGQDEERLLDWEKDLGGNDPDVARLHIALERECGEDDILGEYWQPAWSVMVWLPVEKKPGEDHITHKPDKELSRTLITLLEAVELLPKIEAAAIAKYPRLLMETVGMA